MIKFQNIKSWLTKRNNLILLSGILIGTIGGFMYYYFIGCRSGSCPITSSPWLSMLWGATVGYLLFDLLRKKDQTVVKGGNNKA